MAEPSFAIADQVVEWMRFRERYGLRSDLEYVLRVASNPAARSELSVPLLPAEIEAVAATDLRIETLVPALAKYGEAFGGEYAGTKVDGPRAVIRFTHRLEAHRAALAVLFGSDAPIDVEGAQYSLGQLEAFSEQVESERGWFATIRAELFRASPAELENAVRVRYLSNSLDVEPAILDHFGRPDWMRLKWYGSLPWTGPRGTLRAVVVDETGRRVNGECVLISRDMAAMFEGLPVATRDGVCEFDEIPATVYQVEVSIDGDRTTSERVDVPPNGTAKVRVVVTR
jgi:hypothetical protein